jgi:hypothetical protein
MNNKIIFLIFVVAGFVALSTSVSASIVSEYEITKDTLFTWDQGVKATVEVNVAGESYYCTGEGSCQIGVTSDTSDGIKYVFSGSENYEDLTVSLVATTTDSMLAKDYTLFKDVISFERDYVYNYRNDEGNDEPIPINLEIKWPRIVCDFIDSDDIEECYSSDGASCKTKGNMDDSLRNVCSLGIISPHQGNAILNFTSSCTGDTKKINLYDNLATIVNLEFACQSLLCCESSAYDKVLGKTKIYAYTLVEKGECENRDDYNYINRKVVDSSYCDGRDPICIDCKESTCCEECDLCEECPVVKSEESIKDSIEIIEEKVEDSSLKVKKPFLERIFGWTGWFR